MKKYERPQMEVVKLTVNENLAKLPTGQSSLTSDFNSTKTTLINLNNANS